jgi:hypothetical protein
MTKTFLFTLGLLAAAPLWAADNAALAAKAEAAFGKNKDQRFDAAAVKPATGAPRTETMTVTLAPGKGVEVKADLDAGQGLVFQWTASADVGVDFHGETPESKHEFTSFDVEAAQRHAAGTFVAPFTGLHGWYWKNRSQQPVTVTVTVTGFQKRLFRPGPH